MLYGGAVDVLVLHPLLSHSTFPAVLPRLLGHTGEVHQIGFCIRKHLVVLANTRVYTYLTPLEDTESDSWT